MGSEEGEEGPNPMTHYSTPDLHNTLPSLAESCDHEGCDRGWMHWMLGGRVSASAPCPKCNRGGKHRDGFMQQGKVALAEEKDPTP